MISYNSIPKLTGININKLDGELVLKFKLLDGKIVLITGIKMYYPSLTMLSLTMLSLTMSLTLSYDHFVYCVMAKRYTIMVLFDSNLKCILTMPILHS